MTAPPPIGLVAIGLVAIRALTIRLLLARALPVWPVRHRFPGAARV
jgi:hypothetical protein